MQPPPPVPRSRRFLLIGGAAIALLTIAYGATWLVGPHPDATLLPTHGQDTGPVRIFISASGGGLDTDTLQSYERYRGLEPWSAIDIYGNPCMIVVERSTGFVLEAACTPREADLLVDIGAWPALDHDFAEGLPDGSILRFHLRQDLVDVFVHPVPEGD